MKRFAAAFLALASGAVSAETWSVTASLTDGSELRGTIELDAFQLESSLGMLDIRMENVLSVTIEEGKSVVKLRDGSSLTGKVKQTSWKMGTSVGQVEVSTERLKALVMNGRATAEAPPARPPAGFKPSTVELPAELKPLALDLTTVFAAPIEAAPGGSTLLVLDAAHTRLLAVDSESMTVRASVDLPLAPFNVPSRDDMPLWSLSPGGRIAFVASGRTVGVVDVDAMKSTRKFTVEKDLVEIVAISDDVVLARTTNSTVLISASSQGVLKTWQNNTALNSTPDRKRVITDRGTLLFPAEPSSPRWFPSSGSRISRGRLEFSKDGRWAIDSEGAVYRIGVGSLAELAPTASTARNACAVFLEEAKAVVLFTRDATVDIRSTETFDQIRVIKTGAYGHLAAAAPSGRVVWAVFGSSQWPTVGKYAGAAPLAGPGKLIRFEVPE